MRTDVSVMTHSRPSTFTVNYPLTGIPYRELCARANNSFPGISSALLTSRSLPLEISSRRNASSARYATWLRSSLLAASSSGFPSGASIACLKSSIRRYRLPSSSLLYQRFTLCVIDGAKPLKPKCCSSVAHTKISRQGGNILIADLLGAGLASLRSFDASVFGQVVHELRLTARHALIKRAEIGTDARIGHEQRRREAIGARLSAILGVVPRADDGRAISIKERVSVFMSERKALPRPSMIFINKNGDANRTMAKEESGHIVRQTQARNPYSFVRKESASP